MTIGLITYLIAAPTLPKDTLAARATPLTVDRAGWRAIGALLVLFLPVSLFWATYEQQGNTIVLWADAFTDRSVLGLFDIPVTWFQAFNPFMIFAFTPGIVALWRWQGRREPTTVVKLAIGCLIGALAWLIMAAAVHAADDGKASWLWLAAFFVVLTIGELYLSPTSLSLVTKVAPAGLLSMMMGLWLATYFLGGFLAGYLGTFWSSMGKGAFFLLMAAICATSGVVIALTARPLRDVLRDETATIG
jgi:POT family proton-dependent oligopeptide transporter